MSRERGHHGTLRRRYVVESLGTAHAYPPNCMLRRRGWQAVAAVQMS